jgi:hypothetical protein
MSDDAKAVVPEGCVLIGATYNPKTGNLKHTLLMHEDVDPSVLRQIVDQLPRMKITRKKFGKLHLPPQNEGGSASSFRSRIIVKPGEAISSLRSPQLTRNIIDHVLADLFEKMGDVAGATGQTGQS